MFRATLAATLLITSLAHADNLKWHHDDYAAALAEARKSNRPLLVDLWAPWCHTCLSMKAHVLESRPIAAGYGDKFVWVALDTDRPKNAGALEKLPPEVWPTYYVVDPKTERIVARLASGTTKKGFRAFLDRGLRQMRPSDGSPDGLWAQGDRHATERHYADAARAYGRALSTAPKDWPHRPAVLTALIRAHYRIDSLKDCMALFIAHWTEMSARPSLETIDFAKYALLAAERTQAAPRETVLEQLTTAAMVTWLEDMSQPLTIDDRAEGLRVVRDAYDTTKSEASAARINTRLIRLLDRAWKGASSLDQATWAYPLLESYLYADRPGDVVDRLRTLAEARPKDYDPSYRLAYALTSAGRHDQALIAARQADLLAYGPRQVSIRRLVARIQHARNDRLGEAKAWDRVAAAIRALPQNQQDPHRLKQAEEMAATLRAQ